MDMCEAKIGGYGNGNWKKQEPQPPKTRYRNEMTGEYSTDPNYFKKGFFDGFWKWLFKG